MYIKSVLVVLFICQFLSLQFALSQESNKPVFGPFHALASGSGPGHICWFNGAPPTEPREKWTISAWVNASGANAKPSLVAGFGDGLDISGAQRFIATDTAGWVVFFGGFYVPKRELGPMVVNPNQGWGMDKDPRGEPSGKGDGSVISIGKIAFNAPVETDKWVHLCATYNGSQLTLYVNGQQTAQQNIKLARAAMQPRVAPPSPWKGGACFTGKVASFGIYNSALSSNSVKQLVTAKPKFNKVLFVQAPNVTTPEGRELPYPPGRRSAISPQEDGFKPQVKLPEWTSQPKPKISPRIVSQIKGDDEFILNRGWELIDAQETDLSPEKLSLPGVKTEKWYDATVPGTVLTTLVDQGVYPDPLYGMNNLIIPDLSRKSWWYRVEFVVPESLKNKNIEINFKGINYHAEIWLNGKRIGETTGAFIRGVFNVSPYLNYKKDNVLAVRVWPQPHNGTAHEESIKSGQGPNGADGCLDGPTFVCAEGWDWIPTIRDRNTGIWQDVVIRATGDVKIGDPKVFTTLPKSPDLSVAHVKIETELVNLSGKEQNITLNGKIAGASYSIPVKLLPRETKNIVANPTAFPSLAVQNPELWWPNGYGEPKLHDFNIDIINGNNEVLDRYSKKIGLREVSYDSLPHLCIKVNGQRIMAKGGNWGLTDALKRSSIEMMEPYFKLQKEANITIIRNWVGQNTEDLFYEMCDKYGLMVWNDFWMSTVPGDLPAMDGDLFLANATDVVKRYRTHASIVIWCARNEGDPPYWIDNRLDKMLKEQDGTREYVPNSWGGRVKGGGPYHYSNGPIDYYNTAKGKPFSTELGVNSVPTAEAIRAMLPQELHWPINDAWAYHDFHQNHGIAGGNYFKAIENNYGKSDNLDAFVKRAQLLNYELYRSMFEAWNAYLWNPTSGVMLWMTHPAQHSMVWQIYSKDYDTHASYYATKKACEPVHVQWNIVDSTMTVVNNLFEPFEGTIKHSVYSLEGKCLSSNVTNVTVKANSAMQFGKVDWTGVNDTLAGILKLELFDLKKNPISDNLYWHAAKPIQLQSLNTMPLVNLAGKTSYKKIDGEVVVTIELSNPSSNIALMAHISLFDNKLRQRVLPAYFSDNYITLLPGEKRLLKATVPTAIAIGNIIVKVDGWNVLSVEF